MDVWMKVLIALPPLLGLGAAGCQKAEWMVSIYSNWIFLRKLSGKKWISKLNSEGVQKYELAARGATEFPLGLICSVTDHQVLHYFSIPQGQHTLPDTQVPLRWVTNRTLHCSPWDTDGDRLRQDATPWPLPVWLQGAGAGAPRWWPTEEPRATREEQDPIITLIRQLECFRLAMWMRNTTFGKEPKSGIKWPEFCIRFCTYPARSPQTFLSLNFSLVQGKLCGVDKIK